MIIFVFAYLVVAIIWGPSSQTIKFTNNNTPQPTNIPTTPQPTTLNPTTSPTTSQPSISPTTSKPTTSPIIVPEIINATIARHAFTNVTVYTDSVTVDSYSKYNGTGTNEFIYDTMYINNPGYYWVGYTAKLDPTSDHNPIGMFLNTSAAYVSNKVTGTQYGSGATYFFTGVGVSFTGSKILQLTNEIALSYMYIGQEASTEGIFDGSFISYKLTETPLASLQVEATGASFVVLASLDNTFMDFPANAFQNPKMTDTYLTFNSTGNSEFRTSLSGFYFVGYTWGFSNIAVAPNNFGLGMKYCNNTNSCSYYGTTQLSNWFSQNIIRYDGAAIVYMNADISTVQLTASCSSAYHCDSDTSSQNSMSFFEIIQLPFIKDFIEIYVNDFTVSTAQSIGLNLNYNITRLVGSNTFAITSNGYVHVLKPNYYFLYFQITYPSSELTSDEEIRYVKIQKFGGPAIYAGGPKNTVFTVGYDTTLNTQDHFNASVIISGSYVTYVDEDYYLSAYTFVGPGVQIENVTVTFQIANFA